MPFKPGQSGNPHGRIPKTKKQTNRQKKNEELESLLRKLKPNISKAVVTASTIMQKTEDVKDADKLKACTILLDCYKSVVLELGKDDDGSSDEDGDDEQAEPATVFSLVMPKKED